MRESAGRGREAGGARGDRGGARRARAARTFSALGAALARPARARGRDVRTVARPPRRPRRCAGLRAALAVQRPRRRRRAVRSRRAPPPSPPGFEHGDARARDLGRRVLDALAPGSPDALTVVRFANDRLWLALGADSRAWRVRAGQLSELALDDAGWAACAGGDRVVVAWGAERDLTRWSEAVRGGGRALARVGSMPPPRQRRLGVRLHRGRPGLDGSPSAGR
jgi:hypothetical protein